MSSAGSARDLKLLPSVGTPGRDDPASTVLTPAIRAEPERREVPLRPERGTLAATRLRREAIQKITLA